MSAERAQGWIRISRETFDGGNPFWEEKRKFSRFEAWVDLVRRARFAPGVQVIDGGRVRLERGEFSESVRTLAQAWGWSKTSVHRLFQMCSESGALVKKNRDTKQDVYLIANYDACAPTQDDDRDKVGTTAGQSWDDSGTYIRNKKGRREEGEEGKTTFARSRDKAAASRPEPGLFDSEVVSEEESAGLEAKPTESEGKLLKLPARAQPAKDPPFEIPPLPEDMAGWPRMLEAWGLRLKERAERPKRERPTPSAVLAQFGKLREVAKLHGTDAAVACVLDAAANSYQGTVFPEDLDPHGRRAKDGKGSRTRSPQEIQPWGPGKQKIEDGCIWGPNATIEVR